MGPDISSCGCCGSCRASGGVPMRAALKGECDGSGSGVIHKGGVGIAGGLGACRNATAAGGVTRDDGKSVVRSLAGGTKSCGAVWPRWTSGRP